MSLKLSEKKTISIDINIGDQLTTISCGHILVELIKFIAYQRLQIPYTYQWLKQLITKKKGMEDKKESYKSERHFHIASTALDNLDFVLKSLLKELGGASIPDEVCVAFGATPVSCKEIYRVLLPSVCHKPQCHSTHIASDQKIQGNVFRNLATSDKLNEVFYDSLPPTNMYVFLKKMKYKDQNVVCNDSFVLVNGYRIPRSCKVVVLNLKKINYENIACCNDFSVFGDTISEDLDRVKIEDDEEFCEIETTNDVKWFQSTYVMKGFKDCFINGSSITNTWLQP
ncbi:unnamed protein product [Colias eurytheme]|nr:unnamed protein product [Colias eurytheme]